MELNCLKVGQVALISLGGLLKQPEVDMVRACFQQYRDKGFGYFVVDLSELAFICSAGLRAILELQKNLMATRGELRLVRPEPYIFTAFTLTHLDEALAFYPSTCEALADWVARDAEKCKKIEAAKEKKNEKK